MAEASREVQQEMTRGIPRWVPQPTVLAVGTCTTEVGECGHLPPEPPCQQLLARYRYELSHCNMALARAALAKSPLQPKSATPWV